MTTTGHRVELLAPAGEPRALRAALTAGADAVYFGLDRWSARAFAGNFSQETVLEAVDLAHRYDANAYLALNTLLKDDEVEPALEALAAPWRAGLDALIVADIGFAARLREAYPDLVLHASTQLDTHSSAQLAALERLGFRRAILARELSLAEIGSLDAQGLELEAFVHGALCYGYSGDCLLSSMVGGRSGNRGRCSQACRLRYTLATAARSPSGAPDPAPGRVMSTSDLAAVGVLPQLIAAGVTSFKIEGRMKDPAYVGVTTATYREALDAAVADPEAYRVRPEWTARLEQSFSRSFTTAHLDGRHSEVRSGGRGGHRGVLVGRVARVDEGRGEVEVRLSRPLAAGDLVYLYTPWGQSDPLRIAADAAERLVLRVGERVAVKDRLFRLAAAEVDDLAGDLVSGRAPLRPIGLRMCLVGEAGRPAALAVEPVETGPADALDLSVVITSARPLTAARTVALDESRARQALGALGGTPYRLEELDFAVAEGLFLAVADLKDMRRRAVRALDERRLAVRRRKAGGPSASERRPVLMAATASASGTPGTVAAGDRSSGRRRPPGGDAVLMLRPGEKPVAAPGVGVHGLDLSTSDPPSAVAAAASELAASGLPLRCRLPEVVFDDDRPWLEAVLGLPWDEVVVRHLGVLTLPGVTAGSLEWILEYPLQGLNGLAAGAAAGVAGRPPAAVVLSPETALAEVAALRAGLADGDRPGGAAPSLEILAFGRQQVLHTRDQLGLAEGLYAAPTAGGEVGLTLEDSKGYVFPATADAGGARLFNSRVINLTASLDALRTAGVTRFIVVQADFDHRERAAFAVGGLAALAPLASRERSTTGHLFRGVA